MVPGTRVRRPEYHFIQYGFSSFRHFNVKVIVANKAEKDTVAVNAIVPHHLFDGNLPGAGTLVNDELNEI
jgi:hypothetical protein